MKTYKIRPFQGADGKWYLRVVARNGRTVADLSQGYRTKAHARRAGMALAMAALVYVETSDGTP